MNSMTRHSIHTQKPCSRRYRYLTRRSNGNVSASSFQETYPVRSTSRKGVASRPAVQWPNKSVKRKNLHSRKKQVASTTRHAISQIKLKPPCNYHRSRRIQGTSSIDYAIVRHCQQ